MTAENSTPPSEQTPCASSALPPALFTLSDARALGLAEIDGNEVVVRTVFAA